MMQTSGMAQTARSAADGMDSEVLKQQDALLRPGSTRPGPPTPPLQLRITPPSAQRTMPAPGHRHRNLNFSPNSTSFSKVSSAKYIPREPVKGAVKAVPPDPRVPVVCTSPTSSKSSTSVQGLTDSSPRTLAPSSPPRKLDSAAFGESFSPARQTPSPPKPVLSARPLPASIIDGDNQASPVAEPAFRELTVAEAVASGGGRKPPVQLVQVPFHNAPGRLSAKTYETLEKLQKQQPLDKNFPKSSVPKPEDHLNLEACSQESQTSPDTALQTDSDTDSRSVEGEVVSMKGSSQGEIRRLEKQLELQTKINGDLKKLLVASMGEDLHYRVECLVRTNAQLSSDLDLYSNRISQDGENLDQLGIQADVWRSKYHASRVQVEELLALRASVARLYEDSCAALEELLRERYTLRDSVFNTYRILQQLSDAFEPLPPAARPAHFAPQSVTDIAARNSRLADSVRFRLVGAVRLYPALYNTPTPNVMTPAEQMALQVLCEKPVEADSAGTLTALLSRDSRAVVSGGPTALSAGAAGLDARGFSRYSPHPYTRYDNVVFNCCNKCSGELQTV